MKTSLRVLSLGAGVQSTTLALMIEKGEIPMVQAAVFADVKGEPMAVYKHLDWLEKQLSYPIYRVTWRDLKQDILDASTGKYKAFTAPFYTKNPKTGKKKMLRRQCTFMYKINPVVQEVRRLLGLKKGEKRDKSTRVEMLMGISKDEVFRVKTNRMSYITNIYPLIDKDMTRLNCLEWMSKNNYPKPPRSACTFCPYHSNEEWKEIKKNKEEWQEVVAMDKAIRHQEKHKDKFKNSNDTLDELFLHRDAIPIDQVDFDKKKDNQLDMFQSECEGMCGN
jgi:ribosomal protein L44E